MIGRKKDKSKKDKSKKNITQQKLMLPAISLVGVFICLSTLNFNLGIFGKLLKTVALSAFGYGAFFISILIIIIPILLLLNEKSSNNRIKNIIIAVSIILCLLLLLDSTNHFNSSFIRKISEGIRIGQENKGGGLVGAALGYIFYNLFGSTGTYIIIGATIAALIFIFCNTNAYFYNWIKDKINNVRSLKTKRNEGISLDEFISDANNEKHLNSSNSNDSEETHLLPTFEQFNGSSNNNENISNDDNQENLIFISELSKDEEIDENSNKNLNKNSNENLNTDTYTPPSMELLKKNKAIDSSINNKAVRDNGEKIIETLSSFKIETKITEINIGPSITSYELTPPPGVKLNRIVSLGDNLALSLAAEDIRIEAPIPGKSAVGVEIPNKVKTPVLLREIIDSEEFKKTNSLLPLALGKDVRGDIIVSSINKMPHLLIAGATGSGKSVCINTIIMSILYKANPDEVKLILIDPKVVELNVYNGIPHLMIPVVTDAKKAALSLNWAVVEMEKRYRAFAENNVREIESYNEKVKNKEEKFPLVVIIIDELADLMMVSAADVENYICRLAQMARAAGIYLIVATQRPSVDVITGLIKANIPSRISFAVSSQIDSRTILDSGGAEKLLGKGDMLFFPSYLSRPIRIQGAFISDTEVETIVKSISLKESANYSSEVEQHIAKADELLESEDADSLIKDALEIVIREQQASVSFLQRKLKIGYNRAARIIDYMEENGIIGESEGSKPRKVLVGDEYFEQKSETKNEES